MHVDVDTVTMANASGPGSVSKKRGKMVGSTNSKKTEGRTSNSSLEKQQSKSNSTKKKSVAKESPNSRGRNGAVDTEKKDVKSNRATPRACQGNGGDLSNDSKAELSLVAGKEICGRKVSLWDDGSQSWRNASVVRFKPSLSQHLIRYLDRTVDSVKHEERWIDFSKYRFQFLGPPPPDALPNPSYRKAPKRKAAVGYKIRVFWTVMGKWYLGKVLEYDVESKMHTVKYKDGDEQKLSLRHEAVVYLSPGSPTADSGARGKTKSRIIQMDQGKSPKEAKSGKKDDGEKRKVVASKDDAQQGRKKQKVVERDAEKENILGSAVIGSRLAIYSAKNDGFRKGIVDKYKQEGGQHCILYDNGDMELVTLENLEFRYLSPKTRSGGCTSDFLSAMERFGAEQTKSAGEVKHPSGYVGTVKPAETISRRAPVKGACVSWRLSIRGADRKWYLGEVIAYHAPSDKHIVLYDDGEHEVLHLPSELIAWHCYTKDGKKIVFPGRPNPTDKTHRENVVGWRVAVYWPAEGDFFKGKVAQYDANVDAYEVNYDDGDHSTIRFGEDKIKWIFPPGTYYNSKPFLYRADVQIIIDNSSGTKLEDEEEYEEEDYDDDDVYNGEKSTRRGRPKNSRNKPKIPRSQALLHGQRPMGIADGAYPRGRFSSKSRQVFAIDPTFVRNISTSPTFPGLKKSNSVPLPVQQTAIAVRVYLSDKPQSLKPNENSDVNNLDEMVRRVRRAEESLVRGIPTYLPPSDSKGFDSFKRRSGAMGGVSSKMVVHMKSKQILPDDDSESDNLNNSRAHTTPKFSRFRKTPFVSLASTLPKLPPESSSASSSDEGEQSDPLEEPELVVSPKMHPIASGGKVKPNTSLELKDTNNAIFDPTDDPIAPNGPQPIESPFGDQDVHMDEAPLDIEPAQGALGYHTESVGNLLGMSRNSSEAMLLHNDFQMETMH